MVPRRLAEPAGTPRVSTLGCPMSHMIDRLAALIAERRRGDGGGSYTRQLLDAGPKKCARKLGEEAVELVVAALAEDEKAIRNEAADVIYHLLVLLESRNIRIADVLAVLESRLATSGLAEKEQRKPA